MNKKGNNTKPVNPKPKNYADYIKEALKKGQLTEQEAREAITQSKTGAMIFNKKTYKKYT